MKTKTLVSLIALLGLLSGIVTAEPLGSGFNYQGRLTDGTNAAGGSFDFRMTLYDAATNGSQVGSISMNGSTPVENGYFDVWLDWDDDLDPAFAGEARWLEIGVRPTGDTNDFTILNPRQPITPTPYALYAISAGTAAIAGSATNFSGSVSGDVSGPQGATRVTSVGGQPAADVALGVNAANSATSSGLPNTIVKRDGSGSFSAVSVTVGGSLYLPFPARIYSGSNTVFVEEGSTFLGTGAGFGNSGHGNVGVGDYVLSSSPSGSFNTGTGENALQKNTTGSRNQAGGYQALYSNTTGSDNTALAVCRA